MKTDQYEKPVTVQRMLDAVPPSQDEEELYVARVAAGDESAADELALRHARYAYFFAAKRCPADFDDAFMDAIAGLRKAARRFTEQDASFLSYAKHLVREAVLEGMAQRYLFAGRYSTQMARHGVFRRSDPNVMSLEDQVAPDSMATFADSIPDPEAEEAFNTMGEKLDFAVAVSVVDSVEHEKQRAVIELVYGIRDGVTRNFEEAGNILGLSRERVRILHDDAMRKVRPRMQRSAA